MYVGLIRAHIALVQGAGAIFPSDCFVVGISGDRKRRPAETKVLKCQFATARGRFVHA